MAFKFETKSIWNGADVLAKDKSANQKSLLKTGIKIESDAVLLCPFRFGRLRGSISVQMKNFEHKNPDSGKAQPGDFISKPNKENEALVGTNVNYARYQEYGTVKMAPQPFMRPALDLNRGIAPEIFKKQYSQEYQDYLRERKKFG